MNEVKQSQKYHYSTSGDCFGRSSLAMTVNLLLRQPLFIFLAAGIYTYANTGRHFAKEKVTSNRKWLLIFYFAFFASLHQMRGYLLYLNETLKFFSRVLTLAKKVYKIWNRKEHSFWQKLKEFLIEVFIIVFAVSLSIWFHNKSEHAHQQEDVKQFLLGLKSDLKNDLQEMQNDKQSYLNQQAAFRYITSVKLNQRLSDDSISHYDIPMFNTTALNSNNGRFEGFKSSGKISQIENRELQNDIMDLYQEDIVSLLASTDSYITLKRKFIDYVHKNSKRLTDSTTNMSTILALDEAQNICIPLSSTREVLERYDKCINKMKKIIAEINEEYDVRE